MLARAVQRLEQDPGRPFTSPAIVVPRRTAQFFGSARIVVSVSVSLFIAPLMSPMASRMAASASRRSSVDTNPGIDSLAGFLGNFFTRVDFVPVRLTVERIAAPGSQLRTQPAGSASDEIGDNRHGTFPSGVADKRRPFKPGTVGVGSGTAEAGKAA